MPVHLVTIEQLKQAPRKTVEIEGITTVSLEDLIEIKLRSGSSNVLRAQDLADAIGLIRHHRLTARVRTPSGQVAAPDVPQAHQGAEARGTG